MEIFSDDISQMSFRKIIKENMSNVVLDGDATKVLMSIDESKTGQQVASTLGMPMPSFKRAINTLIENGLVASVKRKVATLGEEFLDELQKEFASVVGPMADVLIEDVISDMDLSFLTIPESQAAELINNLASLIPAEEKRVAFQKTMIQKIG
jgi:phospholipid N-methyltransferase